MLTPSNGTGSSQAAAQYWRGDGANRDELTESLELLCDQKGLRERCLADLSELLERSMRSPLFLAWLRFGLSAMNQAQLFWSRKPLAPHATRAIPTHPQQVGSRHGNQSAS